MTIKMQNQFDPQIETILLSLTRNIGPDEDLYAVGGMVRSIYMQRPVIDIDIVVAGDVYRLGKQRLSMSKPIPTSSYPQTRKRKSS